jgi:hypothetical protein
MGYGRDTSDDTHVTAWRCKVCGAIAENPQAVHYKPGTTKTCEGTSAWVLGDWSRRG